MSAFSDKESADAWLANAVKEALADAQADLDSPETSPPARALARVSLAIMEPALRAAVEEMRRDDPLDPYGIGAIFVAHFCTLVATVWYCAQLPADKVELFAQALAHAVPRNIVGQVAEMRRLEQAEDESPQGHAPGHG